MFTLSPYDLRSPFADELRVFAQAEADGAVPRGAVVFCGSSSIRLWTTLSADFPNLTVLNRGFGGSTLADLVAEMEWMVCAAQPRAIVLYAGDNDLDQGTRPEQVLALFERFMARVSVPVLFVSIKPSLARFGNIAAINRTNALLRDAITSQPQARFVDVASAMLDAGQPRRALFDPDGLHLSAAGYALWTRIIREALAAL